MDIPDENLTPKKKEDDKISSTILDLSDNVIYFGTPTSAEKRLHTMETPPRHVSSRRKTVLLPSKTVLFSAENLSLQENSKEKKKSRRQSYLYATKSSVMLEQQRRMEIQDDEDVALYSSNPFEENTLFMEAPGSVERKIKKRKSDIGRLAPVLSSCQKRRKEVRRFSILDTIAHHPTSIVSRRKSASLLSQKQNKILNYVFEKEVDHSQIQMSFCTKMQAYIRGYLTRRSIALQNQAAKVIQFKYLTILARRNFCKQRRSAIIIQAAWRSWVVRMRYLEIVEACISIQKWWRQLSQQKRTKQKDACISLQEKQITRDVSNNSSLQGFLKKWESKKALAAATKDKNIKRDSLLDKCNIKLTTEIEENQAFHLIEELSSQKTNIPIISDESPKLSRKVSKPKTLLSESKPTSSMTIMLKQSISLSTARILSNPTKSLSGNTHNYHTFQNPSKLPKSRLTAPAFASRTMVLSDISPNSLRNDINEISHTPTKNVKVDGISTGALRVSTPSPKKGACLGSPKKTIKKTTVSRKTALLTSQNIKLLHSSQIISENTPKKNTNSFTNNGLGSPSRQKIANQTEFFTFRNLETNNEERGLYSRPRTIESKTLFTPILQSHVPATKHNAVSQNLYTPYRSLNYLTLGEITKMTRQNTYQNRIYRCDFDRIIVRKNQLRPPSPTAKSQSKLAAEARLRRKKLQKEKTHDYTLGPGDDDNWIPRELTPLKKGVRWDKLLESEFGQSKSNHTLEKSNSKKTKTQKGCLSKKTQMIRLDDLGNVLDAREPLTPIIGKAEKVIVQKFLYKGEEDE
ncbi:uncharacterized protein T551_02672 [Pneumocystis jirovecii RU7]|uniref:Uncharacterized protein n=1 Tax=Pneumocystis jirovecii (strain RU7) TaxID=1408657 RepID=A0A0W4ZIP8_PNEJ7|nr:uncharacterized protein T551_02672 [Pneumocystis jirovecii RU7]KTW28253.1 hypothetical protein T551_02672 [Pneumocystis jirovecii RU7]